MKKRIADVAPDRNALVIITTVLIQAVDPDKRPKIIYA